MQKLLLIVQIVLGLTFLVFGLNGFYHFIPVPPMAPAGQRFIGDLIATGYMLPLWKGTEVIAGALLVVDIFAGLALVCLAPVIVNIAAFHAFLDPKNAPIGFGLVALAVVTAWRNRRAYTNILSVRAASI
jgi:uncharacterized membrane protein YphA (DoxX/SURF4 family)